VAGRPKLTLDTSLIEKLASIQCSNVEIAAILGCHPDTLRDNYSTNLDKGRQQGKMTLRRKQWDVAMKGNVTMLIWLGKQYLEQSDKSNLDLNAKGPLVLKYKVEKDSSEGTN
jgi:hypothetical protein